ncbi:MAG: nuclear transport factor 2 family protein [Gammaproteobacteria bacterium]
MQLNIFARAGVLVVTGFAMVSCGTPPTSPADLNQSYERALARTAPLAVALTPGSMLEQQAFDNLQRYFDGMTAASVREQTAQVYAPQAYLNDTMAGIEGAGNIQAYFSHTMESASLLRVEFLDRATTGTDWYVRWRMTTVADALDGGSPVRSYGVTQFRFDGEVSADSQGLLGFRVPGFTNRFLCCGALWVACVLRLWRRLLATMLTAGRMA